MSQPIIDVDSLPMPGSLSKQVPDPDSEVEVKTPVPSTLPATVKPDNEASPSVEHPQENCDEKHVESDEHSSGDSPDQTPSGSNAESAHDRAIPLVTEQLHDLDGTSSHDAHPAFSHPQDRYPPATDHIRLNLLQCRDDLFDLVSDLCEENSHLANMYEEIRTCPMASEMKEEYESTIRSLEDQVASLKSNYDKLYEDNLLLKEDYDSLQRDYHNLCDQSKQDLEASESRCAALVKDCDTAQEKVDRLRESNCELEAKLGEERKKLRDANLTIHRLQLRVNSVEASRSRGGASESERRTESVSSTTYESRYDDEPANANRSRNAPYEGEARRDSFEGPSESRRGPSDIQSSYRDRFVSRDSPRQPRQDLIVVSRAPPAPREVTAVALYDYEGGSGSLPLKAGMRMTLIKYSDAGDWAYVSINGKKTWEPTSYLEVQTPSSVERPVERSLPSPMEKPSPRLSVASTKSTPAPMPVSSGLVKRAVVIADFEGEESVEMSVRKGEVISVLKKDADWLLGEVGSRKGWVPVSFVQFL